MRLRAEVVGLRAENIAAAASRSKSRAPTPRSRRSPAQQLGLIKPGDHPVVMRLASRRQPAPAAPTPAPDRTRHRPPGGSGGTICSAERMASAAGDGRARRARAAARLPDVLGTGHARWWSVSPAVRTRRVCCTRWRTATRRCRSSRPMWITACGPSRPPMHSGSPNCAERWRPGRGAARRRGGYRAAYRAVGPAGRARGALPGAGDCCRRAAAPPRCSSRIPPTIRPKRCLLNLVRGTGLAGLGGMRLDEMLDPTQLGPPCVAGGRRARPPCAWPDLCYGCRELPRWPIALSLDCRLSRTLRTCRAPSRATACASTCCPCSSASTRPFARSWRAPPIWLPKIVAALDAIVDDAARQPGPRARSRRAASTTCARWRAQPRALQRRLAAAGTRVVAGRSGRRAVPRRSTMRSICCDPARPGQTYHLPYGVELVHERRDLRVPAARAGAPGSTAKTWGSVASTRIMRAPRRVPPGMDTKWLRNSFVYLIILVAIIALFFTVVQQGGTPDVKPIALNDLAQRIQRHEIKSIEVTDDRVLATAASAGGADQRLTTRVGRDTNVLGCDAHLRRDTPRTWPRCSTRSRSRRRSATGWASWSTCCR